MRLNERALAAFEAHLKRRARLLQRIADLEEKLDHEYERIMLEVLDHMGLETDCFEMDERFYDEFGVVLIREGNPFYGEDEDCPPDGEDDEGPGRTARLPN